MRRPHPPPQAGALHPADSLTSGGAGGRHSWRDGPSLRGAARPSLHHPRAAARRRRPQRAAAEWRRPDALCCQQRQRRRGGPAAAARRCVRLSPFADLATEGRPGSLVAFAGDVNAQAEGGETPLHRAVQRTALAMVKVPPPPAFRRRWCCPCRCYESDSSD